MKAGRGGEANDRFLDAFDAGRPVRAADLLAEAALGYGGVLPAGLGAQRQGAGACSSRPSPRCPRATAAPGPSCSVGWPSGVTSTAPGASAGAHRRRRRPWHVGSTTPRPWRRSSGTATGPWTVPTTSTTRSPWPVEIRDLGEQIGDSEILLQGLKCELHARFELGDYEASRRVAAEPRRPGRPRSSNPSTSAWATCGTAWWPGPRVATPTPRPTRHRRPPSSNGPSTPSSMRSYFGLSLPWRWLQGRMEDLRLLLEIGKTGRASPGETALVAWVASEIGERDQAEALLSGWSPAHVADGDRNFHWWFLMVGLAQTAVNLGRPGMGGGALRPHRALCRPQLPGRAGHVPGCRLLAAREPWPFCSAATRSPSRHLESALARHEAWGRRPFAGHDQTPLGHRPPCGPPSRRGRADVLDARRRRRGPRVRPVAAGPDRRAAVASPARSLLRRASRCLRRAGVRAGRDDQHHWSGDHDEPPQPSRSLPCPYRDGALDDLWRSCHGRVGCRGDAGGDRRPRCPPPVARRPGTSDGRSHRGRQGALRRRRSGHLRRRVLPDQRAGARGRTDATDLGRVARPESARSDRPVWRRVGARTPRRLAQHAGCRVTTRRRRGGRFGGERPC